MSTDRRLIDALRGTAEIYGRQLSDMAATMLVSDLKRYTTNEILASLERCRTELKYFPTIADIVSRIPDTRPGIEEAWAMIPKDEYSTTVWTEEMAEAYSIARGLLNEGDAVGARMAFKETYAKLVDDAKAKGRPAKWSVSLGLDTAGRSQALERAVTKGHLTDSQARALLPDYNARPPVRAQLTGPAETPRTESAPELSNMIGVIRNILKNAPEGVRKQQEAKLEVKRIERSGNVIELTEEQIKERKRVLLDQARILEAQEKQTHVAPPSEPLTSDEHKEMGS